MKILFNKLNGFLKFKNGYYEDLREIHIKNKNKNNDVYLKLLEQQYIKTCQEIVDKELEKGTKNWLTVKSYFCYPYSISIWNNNEDIEFIEWNEKIFDISVEKLSKILEDSNKKYLKLRCNFCLCGWMQEMVKLEKE